MNRKTRQRNREEGTNFPPLSLTAPFRACSGQGRARQWSVCYEVPDRQWWRPLTPNGQVRRFASFEAAQRFAGTLSVITVELALAREAAAALRKAFRDPQRWRSTHLYPGIRAAFWGRDPFGFFTAGITEEGVKS
mgnify:CR=1 FL=1